MPATIVMDEKSIIMNHMGIRQVQHCIYTLVIPCAANVAEQGMESKLGVQVAGGRESPYPNYSLSRFVTLNFVRQRKPPLQASRFAGGTMTKHDTPNAGGRL